MWIPPWRPNISICATVDFTNCWKKKKRYYFSSKYSWFSFGGIDRCGLTVVFLDGKENGKSSLLKGPSSLLPAGSCACALFCSCVCSNFPTVRIRIPTYLTGCCIAKIIITSKSTATFMYLVLLTCKIFIFAENPIVGTCTTSPFES